MTIHRDLPEKFETCYPILREKEIGSRKTTFVLLVPERQPGQNVLLHIRTAGPYTRNTKGWVRVVSGEAKLLAQGYGAHGDAGRLGTWDDDLWEAAPNTVFKVEYFGGHKVPLYALVVDSQGVPSMMLWDEYETIKAVSEMINEEENNETNS